MKAMHGFRYTDEELKQAGLDALPQKTGLCGDTALLESDQCQTTRLLGVALVVVCLHDGG